jgi:hypothetical protein
MVNDDNVIALPYGRGANRNSGFRGSETSEQRARTQDSNGETGRRQSRAISLLAYSRQRGLTWKELDDLTGWNHHGKTTGTLSNLHKVGLIARLTQTRDRCKVYVLPDYVFGREVEPHGSKSAEPSLLEQAIEMIRETVGDKCRIHSGRAPDPECWSCRATRLVRIYDQR